MPIFEVAVIEKATLVGEQNGQTDKLVLAPTTFVAKDGNSAILQAGALLAKGTVPYEPQRAEVQIRPFLK